MPALPGFHALIAGGGPAGSAAALTLAREGRRVLLADVSPAAGAFRIGEALPPAARPLLRDLGVLDRFLDDGHLPSFGNVSVWGSDQAQIHDHIFDPHGHGWHLDRARFDALLRGAAREAGAEIVEGVGIGDVEREDGVWRVHLGDGSETREVRAAWLVDATGRRSAIARRLGARRRQDDRLVAFYGRFRSNDHGDADARTMVESAPDGWGYTALIPSGRPSPPRPSSPRGRGGRKTERIVVWLTDADLADRMALLSPSGFTAQIQECPQCPHIAALLERFGYALQGRPRGIGAGSSRLNRFAGDGWIAVGDAALAFDPLSSQGMLNALYTGLRGGQALVRALAGDNERLAEYARRLEEVYGTYLRNRLTFYTAESRWAGRTFWQRRAPASEPRAEASRALSSPPPRPGTAP